ncbi:imidazole glycerol phosphate synthase subunit HisH [Paenibacillus antibioticophila]|uniref:Imidazole glycerol phosphate synthase subunit HisH n=1 Tax=Paenibacillus antibioticophila TaxID=1274374 RepID=A0A919XXM8_9BACL|nr:imidazole glycerol phosphate synthase subunit HisH [Paenibacillus antibioticophila]GIO38255.1 imidazole glycerol phosphate synthase subunit HisH [Paenibacillus antibioticophila]
MAIAIVDYGMGNLHSVSKAVERLGYEAVVTGDAETILSSDGVLLPGVGAFGDAMSHLRETGLDVVVRRAAADGLPLLGICLGMQLLFDSSEEHGRHEGLGLLPGRVERFAGDSGLKVPHMGWNRLEFLQQNHPILAGLTEGHVYFVHSYHVLTGRSGDLLAVTDYGHPVTAIVGHDNVYGMQFHPEKSGELGMSLLRNFLELAVRGRE